MSSHNSSYFSQVGASGKPGAVQEFKLEAVRLVRERGVSAAQAARDLDVHESLLRKWVCARRVREMRFPAVGR
jgi:predicted DNA-binding protein (UPF0251 family)